MRKVILLLMISSASYGQLPNTTKYDLTSVIKVVRKSKSSSAGTKEIISSISHGFEGENRQLELITFYRKAYDYKIVDKKILKNLIDSLADHGVNENVKHKAVEARHSVENRFMGEKIKDFEFPDKNDNLIKLSSFNQKIVIIDLWATWCGPCMNEMRKIPELRATNQNIEFYSISLDKSSEKMKQFIRRKKYDWPIVFGGYVDSNKELWNYLNIVAVPKYYTIDRNGIVIDVADNLNVEFINGLK